MGKPEISEPFGPLDDFDTGEAYGDRIVVNRLLSDESFSQLFALWDAEQRSLGYNTPTMTEGAQINLYYVVKSEAHTYLPGGTKDLPYFEIEMMSTPDITIEEITEPLKDSEKLPYLKEDAFIPSIEDIAAAAQKSEILRVKIPMNSTSGYPLTGGYLVLSTDTAGKTFAPFPLKPRGAPV